MTPEYAFRPMTAADLPTIRALARDAACRAAGGADPAEQYELVSGDLDHPDMDPVHRQRSTRSAVRLSAVLQSQRLESPAFGPQPAGTRGIDQFIGEAGHDRARPWLGASSAHFADRLLASGTPRVVTDPDPRQCARRSAPMRRPDFARDAHLVDTPDGPALLMVRDPMSNATPHRLTACSRTFST